MLKIAQVLRLIGDETRLRVLILVSQSPLNVSELTYILGIAQSGVSRHLSHLRKIGLLQERREGVWSYYQLVSKESLDSELLLLWNYLQEQLSTLTDPFNDQVRLKEILRQREVKGPGLNERLLEPGQSWFAWSRCLGMLIPGMDIADLGCGDGTLTIEMSRFAKSVIGIDYNADTLAIARQRVARMNIQNVTLVSERLESLSLPSNSIDIAFFSQSLHHLPNPQKGLNEAVRILRLGGKIIIMEIARHQETWVQEKLGHAWFGFEQDDLKSMMEKTNLKNLYLEVLAPRKDELFQVMLASGIKSQHR